MEGAALISRLANDTWRVLLTPLLDTDQAVRDAAYESWSERSRMLKTEMTRQMTLVADV